MWLKVKELDPDDLKVSCWWNSGEARVIIEDKELRPRPQRMDLTRFRHLWYCGTTSRQTSNQVRRSGMNMSIQNMFKQLNIHSTDLWCLPERQRPYIESQVLIGYRPGRRSKSSFWGKGSKPGQTPGKHRSRTSENDCDTVHSKNHLTKKTWEI